MCVTGFVLCLPDSVMCSREEMCARSAFFRLVELIWSSHCESERTYCGHV